MCGVRLVLSDLGQPARSVGFAAPQDGGREGRAGAIELDQAGDHARPASDMVELSRQPVGRRRRVRVGRGDQSIDGAQRCEPVSRGVHPEPSCGSRTAAGAGHDREQKSKPLRRRSRDDGGLVAAGVGDDDRLERVSGNGLARERLQAGDDRLLLVVRRHDDDAHDAHRSPGDLLGTMFIVRVGIEGQNAHGHLLPNQVVNARRSSAEPRVVKAITEAA